MPVCVVNIPQKGPLMWVVVGGEGRCCCPVLAWMEGTLGLTAPQYHLAPGVPSDMASAWWLTLSTARKPHLGMPSQHK